MDTGSRSVRTTSHVYPQEELNVMMNYYGGKRCVIQRKGHNVEWAHILDAALMPSNMRLSEMLIRKLRQDRHPRYAAEVRENLVPLNGDHHKGMDIRPTQSTLFLHEDLLARTLDYEQNLRDWRIAELHAGRSDPGRPEYKEVFGDISNTSESITQHRYHAGNSFDPFFRNVGADLAPFYEYYFARDCPGIDNPDSQKNFPIINTLLSIPFSLLHTLPRLAAILPVSTYQQQLIIMGLEIIGLWWWDPSPEMIAQSEKICCQNLDANQHNDTRTARPYPIRHSSRNVTTFETKKPPLTCSTPHTLSSIHQGPQTIESSSGQILLGGMLSLSQGKDGLLILGNDELGGMEDVQHADKGIFVGGTGLPGTSLPVTSEAWDVQSPESIEGFDDIDSIDEDVEEQPPICRSSSDIMSWYEKVVDSSVELLPLTSAPYERGVIGGSSTNDLLMIKGLMDPRVYIQFFDLSHFSCL